MLWLINYHRGGWLLSINKVAFCLTIKTIFINTFNIVVSSTLLSLFQSSFSYSIHLPIQILKITPPPMIYITIIIDPTRIWIQITPKVNLPFRIVILRRQVNHLWHTINPTIIRIKLIKLYRTWLILIHMCKYQSYLLVIERTIQLCQYLLEFVHF